MKIAVTGATGFVGRHVLAELQRRQIDATVLARPSSRLPPSFDERQVVRFDPVDDSGAAFAAAGRPDVLIHLAWGGLPNYRSLHHFEQEAPAHYRWLKGMLKAGLPQLVVAGTCFEYGMQSGALNEAMETRPANPYGFAKDMLRRQLQMLQQKWQQKRQEQRPFALTWARLFYMHGDDQPAASLLPQLRAAVARGDATFPMSGGEQLRDYLSASDVARSLVEIALTGHDNGIVNICSGRPVSVRALVEGWIAANGWPIRPELGRFPYAEYEPMAFWGERSKLDHCLAAFPSFNMSST